MSKLEYTIAVFGINHVAPCFAVRRCVQAWVLLVVLICCGFAHGAQEKIYRTGLEAKRGNFSVSPDGRYIVFESDRMAHGLRLLELENGKVSILPTETGRAFGAPSWSPDGRQLAVVSAAVRDNRYSMEDIQITLLDTATWQRRTIVAGEGVKFSPFFSADGKTVYYFSGKKRVSGKTIASRFDLCSIELVNGREEQITNERFYQVNSGDEQAGTVLFGAIPSSNDSRFRDDKGGAKSHFLLYDKSLRDWRLFALDQSIELLQIRNPLRDKVGNVYFVAAKNREGGGNYRWFIFKTTPEGKAPVALAELPASMGFDIAKKTGEIYVMDSAGGELIIRKLAATAAH